MKRLIERHFTNRAYSLIEKYIASLKVDLSGQVILTEAGSGYYQFLPLIASMAGAKKVVAWTSDSVYGKAAEIIGAVAELQMRFCPDTDFEIRETRFNSKDLNEATIITNSGHLRPLDNEKLSYVNPMAVIPLMYEKWELRKQDIDVDYCSSRGIRVAGTNESDRRIDVFSYVSSLGVKMAHEAGFEVYNNDILIWSDDDFGKALSHGFTSLGAKKAVVSNHQRDLDDSSFDFIFLADYSEERDYRDVIDWPRLIQKNPQLGIVHLYGDVNQKYFEELGCNIYPRKNGEPQKMTFTLGHVGLAPIIALQTAGLKVAEEMITGQLSELTQKINF
jgi:hypothetical protein